MPVPETTRDYALGPETSTIAVEPAPTNISSGPEPSTTALGPAPSTTTMVDPQPAPAQVVPEPPADPLADLPVDLGDERVFCESCDKWYNGPTHWELHKDSEKHMKNVRRRPPRHKKY